jgi:hypothetical protein
MPKRDEERRINQTPTGAGAGGVLIVPSSASIPPSAGVDISVDGHTVSRAGNRVLLFSGSGALLVEYSTITAALADAAAGDVVEVPAGTWSESVTVPTGVSLRGRGPASIINGYVTVNGVLRDCTVYQSVNTSSDIVGVIADTEAVLSHVDITLVQAGSGKALGILGVAEEAEEPADAYDCNINVYSASGSAWGFGGSVEGNIRVHQGSVVSEIGA